MPRTVKAKRELGAEYVADNGYRYRKTRDGWKAVHRIIIEEELGRPLKKGERVVFIDGDKTNLDPSNLQLSRRDGSISSSERETLIESLKSRILLIQQRIAQLENESETPQRMIQPGELPPQATS